MSRVELVNRREFLGGLFSAGTLVLASTFLPEEAAAAQGASSARGWQSGVYLAIEPTGLVHIVAHRSEMGTGIRTGLPKILAEELEADWKQVRIDQATGDTKYGNQNTDGSCSIVDFLVPFRDAGASARIMLERAAAAKWGVAASECKAKNHQVVHTPTGRRLGYGELAALASSQPVPAKGELTYKSPKDYRYVGKDTPITDLDELCNGKAVFGIDAVRPGMVFASVERPPVYGGTLRSCDDSAALKVRGVKQTVTLGAPKEPILFQPLGGVAVVADNSWAAMQGRKQLKVEWNLGDNAKYDSDAFRDSLLAAARQPQKVVRKVGDVDAELARGGKVHEAEYYTPLLAHVPMEPPAAVAEWRDGKVIAWAATQNPQAVQETVASVLGIDKKDVICHVTLLGGGFGRKSKPDYIAEAALISKQVGKPVKIVWSREDDVRHDYYHTTAAMYLKAAVDGKGKPTALLQRTVFPTIGSTFDSKARYGADFEMAHGWLDMPFDIPNIRAENGPAQNHVRIGWLRSVANIYHAFAIQSFIDELAAAAGRDRIEYFLDVLGAPRQIDYAAEGTANSNYGRSLKDHPVDTGRMRRVVETVARQSGWSRKKSRSGHGFGFAAHRSFLSYVAAVAEVETDRQGKVRIRRMDIAVDAGQVIDPDRVRSQFEGAAAFGASIALLGEIGVRGGRIQQSNFHDFQVVRIDQAPYETRVHLVPSNHSPGGVGEPGVPPSVAAIVNAVFAATGKRVRHLPISKTRLV
jgi:isoquinoline 1-oxidoreductase beta subunit